MKVILSIKPEFAGKIFDGSKKFEFRRTIFKDTSIQNVIVYASAPISKVIGEFEIDEIIHSKIKSLWNETKDSSGITKSYYLDYFEGKDFGYAIKIKKTKKYKKQRCINTEYGMKAPQSFAYLRQIEQST